MLLSENRDLHSKVKAMSLTIDDVTARNVRLQLERDTAVVMREAGNGAGDGELTMMMVVMTTTTMMLMMMRR